MASVQGPGPKDTHPKRGKVKEVKQQWRVYEDGAMAHGIQEDEFSYKYGLNRNNNRTVRDDIPVAKLVHSEEEERIQKEHLHHLEKQKEVADRDAAMALLVHEDEKRRMMSEHQNRVARAQEDSRVARQASEEEQRRMMAERLQRQQLQRQQLQGQSPPSPEGLDEDAVVAGQFQRAMILGEYQQQLQQEMEDENIARQLQEKERKKYERRLKERELAKERKRLEKEQQRSQDVMLSGYRKPSGGAQPPPAPDVRGGEEDSRVLRHDGKVEDAGDFSDFYIKPSGDMQPQEQQELQQLQDEELARLLQDQEHKRGAKANTKDNLRDIEARDAQLARIMYEQEKLKAKKKKVPTATLR